MSFSTFFTILFTGLLVVSSFLTFVAICVQAWIYYYQLQQMRDAAGAAKMSADVANRSLLILERSRITVSKFTPIETDGGIRFRYVVEVLNTGHIPASIYERQFTFYPTNAPLPKIPPEEEAPIQGLVTIGPSQSMQFRSTESHPLPTGQTVYVIGVFRYRDDLGDSRETRFCAEYSEKITWMVDKPGYNIAT